MINLKDKKILVTGASGGIGFSLIKVFDSLGAEIVATGTNEDKLKKLSSQFKKIKTIKFNITNHQEIENFIEEVCKSFSKSPDILINNAGITRDNLSLRMSLEEWNEVINLNLTSTFLLCKFALKKMIKNKFGKIVNITSVVGHTGNVGQANYAASKAGLVGMTKSLALEYAKKIFV